MMNNLEALLANHNSVLYDALDCDYCVYYHNDEPCMYEFRMCEQGYREWLLAEHVDGESCRQDAEQGERQESPDCEIDSREKPWHERIDDYLATFDDSREKLEADCEKLIRNIQERIFSGRDAGALRCQLKELLNRQAAITEREIEKKWSSFSDSADGHISELTNQLESAHAKNRALKAHIAKMQEGRHGWHIKGKELQKEADMLKKQLETAQDVNERQDLEYVSLSREIGTLRAERDRYRELCGKLLDAADEMRRVRDQFDAFTEVD